MTSISTEIFDRSASLVDYLKTRFEFSNVINIKPEINECPTCKIELSAKKIKKTGYLITSLALDVDVFVNECNTQDCSNFGKEFYFQGTCYGIINIHNKFFVTVEIIKEYFELYSKNGTPFSTFLPIKLEMTQLAYTNNNNNILPLTDVSKIKAYTGALHESFCESIKLFLYEKKSFFCCESPRCLQVDGVVISIQTKKMPDLIYPWLNSKVNSRASNRKDRQLEPLNKLEEDLLKKIIESKTCTSNEKNIFENSLHIGARVIGFCLIKVDNEFNLYQGTEFFAKTLIKKVAASASILPQSCIIIINK